LIKGEIKKINLKNNNSIVRCQNFKSQIKEWPSWPKTKSFNQLLILSFFYKKKKIYVGKLP
jgi:hypothetical protein